MNVFEYAMKMELDGKAWYEKMAEETESEILRKILLDMSEDEERHYEIFKKLKEWNTVAAAGMLSPETDVLDNARNLFEKMAAQGEKPVFSQNALSAWESLRKTEGEAEKFYRDKAAESDNKEAREALLMIADEERKHWVVIDKVINFLSAPERWLENAEWRTTGE